MAARSDTVTISAFHPTSSGELSAEVDVDPGHDQVGGQHDAPRTGHGDRGGVVADPQVAGGGGRAGRLEPGAQPVDELEFVGADRVVGGAAASERPPGPGSSELGLRTRLA